MHAIAFLSDPSKIPVQAVYAVHGDDAFLRRETLSAIVKTVLDGEADDLAAVRIAGDHATLADVLDEVRTPSFFHKRKIVIVESADPFVTAHRKELEAYVEHCSKMGSLVLLVKTWPANTRLAKLVERVGLSVECKGPPERDLGSWLTHRAKQQWSVELDEDAARLLLELVGPEIGLLVNELEKLVVYVGSRAKIHTDDVARMVGAGRIETVWKALDAATSGRGDVALDHLDRLIAAGEHPIAILSGISFSLLKVHHAGQLRRDGMRLEDACREAGMKVYPGLLEKVRQQHAHLGPKRVDEIPGLLLRADLDLKGASQLEPRVVLETLLVVLSRPRRA
jgi:DNA polymerase-3 subunit delta